MVSAVGSSTTYNVAHTSVVSTAGIEAQIARDEKELANCVNCVSAETKQGQADIQALSNKINLAKARLEQITTDKPGEQAGASNPAINNEARVSGTTVSAIASDSNAAASIAEYRADDNSATAANAPDAISGRLVDEYV